MGVLAFKQNVAKRVQEDKEHAKSAVRRKRQQQQREPLLFHNGTKQRPVIIFRTNRPNPARMTQADIDALPMGHEPTYANQLFGKVVRGELKRGFWARFHGRFSRG